MNNKRSLTPRAFYGYEFIGGTRNSSGHNVNVDYTSGDPQVDSFLSKTHDKVSYKNINGTFNNKMSAMVIVDGDTQLKEYDLFDPIFLKDPESLVTNMLEHRTKSALAEVIRIIEDLEPEINALYQAGKLNFGVRTQKKILEDAIKNGEKDTQKLANIKNWCFIISSQYKGSNNIVYNKAFTANTILSELISSLTEADLNNVHTEQLIYCSDVNKIIKKYKEDNNGASPKKISIVANSTKTPCVTCRACCSQLLDDLKKEHPEIKFEINVFYNKKDHERAGKSTSAMPFLTDEADYNQYHHITDSFKSLCYDSSKILGKASAGPGFVNIQNTPHNMNGTIKQALLTNFPGVYDEDNLSRVKKENIVHAKKKPVAPKASSVKPNKAPSNRFAAFEDARSSEDDSASVTENKPTAKTTNSNKNKNTTHKRRTPATKNTTGVPTSVTLEQLRRNPPGYPCNCTVS